MPPKDSRIDFTQMTFPDKPGFEDIYRLLFSMGQEQVQQRTILDSMQHILEDNGQPGLVTQVRDLAMTQRLCQAAHIREAEMVREAKAELLVRTQARERRLIAACVGSASIASAFLTWLLNQGIL